MGVAQFTTPTFELTFDVESLDLTEANNVYVTFKSQIYNLTKTGADLVIEPKKISVFLNQDETSHFRVGPVFIQANWTLEDDKRVASDIVSYEITEQLLKEVVE